MKEWYSRLAGIASSLDDDDMQRLCARMEALEELDISCHDRVTDAGLLHLCKCTKLRSVSLARNTRITVKGARRTPSIPS
eukprot:5597870-Pyramimonas_sp.AAC.3